MSAERTLSSEIVDKQRKLSANGEVISPKRATDEILNEFLSSLKRSKEIDDGVLPTVSNTSRYARFFGKLGLHK